MEEKLQEILRELTGFPNRMSPENVQAALKIQEALFWIELAEKKRKQLLKPRVESEF